MRLNNWYQHELQERMAERKPQARPTRKPAVFPPCTPALWPDMRTYLEGRELDYYLACDNKWYPSNAAVDNEPRIVMPATRTDEGVFWQARAMGANEQKRYQSPSTAREDALILVYPNAPTKEAAIVEGPMDALAAASIGLIGIALMGNTPNQVVLEHIADQIRKCSLVYVISDANALTNWVRLATWIRMHTKVLTQLWYPYPYSDFAAMPLKDRQLQLRQRSKDV